MAVNNHERPYYDTTTVESIKLADALAARGHDTGAVYHLPELNDGETSDISDTTTAGDRVEPTRSEPADFGHGETTGVQEL